MSDSEQEVLTNRQSNSSDDSGPPLFFTVPDMTADDDPYAEGQTGRGCNAVAANAFAYFFAAAGFLTFLNVPGLYKLPFPAGGNLLPYSLEMHSFENGLVIVEVVWLVHFLRRFIEVLFVHVYRRKSPCIETVGASVYYLAFGVWVGWAMNTHHHYYVPHLGFLVPGLVLFVLGEIGNCITHVMLRRMRTRKPEVLESAHARSIPTGFLFEYVTCPHYLCELVSWLGFLLVCLTLAGAVFLLLSAVTLVLRARANHVYMRKTFHGRNGMPLYPPARRALIPFIY